MEANKKQQSQRQQQEKSKQELTQKYSKQEQRNPAKQAVVDKYSSKQISNDNIKGKHTQMEQARREVAKPNTASKERAKVLAPVQNATTKGVRDNKESKEQTQQQQVKKENPLKASIQQKQSQQRAQVKTQTKGRER